MDMTLDLNLVVYFEQFFFDAKKKKLKGIYSKTLDLCINVKLLYKLAYCIFRIFLGTLHVLTSVSNITSRTVVH